VSLELENGIVYVVLSMRNVFVCTCAIILTFS